MIFAAPVGGGLMTRKVVFVACLAMAVVFVTAVPTSAASVAPTVWAPKFCMTIQSFQQKLNSDGAAADKALSGEVTDLKAAKSELVSFLNKSVSNAKHAVQQLQRAGTPKTTNGSKITAKLQGALSSAQHLFATAASNARAMPTSTLSKFEASSQSISVTLRKGGDAISTSFSDVGKLDTGGALSSVLQATPSCAFLGSTGNTTTTTG
jgi:hypothetical protein